MYLSKQYLEICMFCTYVQATQLSIKSIKNFIAWIVRLQFIIKAVNKHVCCAWLQIFVGTVVLWMLNLKQWSMYVNSVLPYLSSHNQYRMCISRSGRCAFPIVQAPYSYLRKLLCLLSFLSWNMYIVSYAYLVYCTYTYLYWIAYAVFYASFCLIK